MDNTSWKEHGMICSEKNCDNKFIPHYRNGIIESRKCPNCRLKALRKPSSSKSVQLTSDAKTKPNKPEKRKKTERQKWMDKADKIFSQYIRLKFSFMSGGELYCSDIITGRVYGIKNIDNGHCFSRAHKTTRFEEDNCRPQNRSSNRFSGEADHYKFIENLKMEIGEERFSRIEALKDSTGEDSATFYRLRYQEYKTLFEEELERRSIKNPWK